MASLHWRQLRQDCARLPDRAEMIRGQDSSGGCNSRSALAKDEARAFDIRPGIERQKASLPVPCNAISPTCKIVKSFAHKGIDQFVSQFRLYWQADIPCCILGGVKARLPPRNPGWAGISPASDARVPPSPSRATPCCAESEIMPSSPSAATAVRFTQISARPSSPPFAIWRREHS